MYATATLTHSYRSRNEDRLDVIPHPRGLVLVLADGAGGTSGGVEAADAVLLWARSYASRADDLADPTQWADLLAKIDHQLSFANGQTTAVIVALSAQAIAGASVGDSAAWLITADGLDILTAGQHAKPLLGTGRAVPVPFRRPPLSATLFLASDGLTKYAPPAVLCAQARHPDLAQAARALIDAVRLKSGALQDDTSVILVRPRAQTSSPSGRKRYRLTSDGDMIEDQ